MTKILDDEYLFNLFDLFQMVTADWERTNTYTFFVTFACATPKSWTESTAPAKQKQQ